MNLQESYKLFELTETASDDDIKKQYKKLSKQYHPDRNKEPGAEEKFKKINAAHETLKNRHIQTNPFDFQSFQVENIDVYEKISFKESVLGTKKEIKYHRRSKCNHCHSGKKLVNNGCVDCNGTGMKTINHSNAIFRTTCDKCHGRTKTITCSICMGQGSVEGTVNVQVSIPPGIRNHGVLRLQGMGHYSSNFIMDFTTDVHLHIQVENYKNLYLSEMDVCLDLPLTFKEAILGCVKDVETIDGIQKITIPKLSKNKEEVIIPKVGVARQGSQRVILEVSYPENIQDLIKEV